MGWITGNLVKITFFREENVIRDSYHDYQGTVGAKQVFVFYDNLNDFSKEVKNVYERFCEEEVFNEACDVGVTYLIDGVPWVEAQTDNKDIFKNWTKSLAEYANQYTHGLRMQIEVEKELARKDRVQRTKKATNERELTEYKRLKAKFEDIEV